MLPNLTPLCVCIWCTNCEHALRELDLCRISNFKILSYNTIQDLTGFNGIKLGDGKIHLLAMSNKWSNTLIHVHMCNKPWWEKSALVYYTSVMSHYVIKLRYLYPNTLEIGCARFKYPSLLSKFCLIYHGIWYWNDLPKNSSNPRTHYIVTIVISARQGAQHPAL